MLYSSLRVYRRNLFFSFSKYIILNGISQGENPFFKKKLKQHEIITMR
jgi:hypothetical protein